MESNIMVIPNTFTILYFCGYCFEFNELSSHSGVCYHNGENFSYTNYGKIPGIRGEIARGFTPHIINLVSFPYKSGIIKYERYCGVCDIDVDKESLSSQKMIEVNFKKALLLETCSPREWENLFKKSLKP